jgi:hypothetical protein
MSEQKPAGVKRGFTTLQLLQLAAFATANGLVAAGQVPIKAATKTKPAHPEKISQSGTVPRQLALAIPGLIFPAKTRLNVMDAMIKAGWFHDGKKSNAFRAKTAEGQQIERLRGQIINYLVQYLAYLSPQFWAPPAQTGITAGKVAAGSALNDVLRTSWTWGSQKTGITLQQRYEAVRNVMSATTGEEPADAERTGGGIGKRRDWTQEDVTARVNISNGFLSKNVKKYLMASVKKDARVGASQDAQAQAARVVGPAIRQAFGIGADVTLGNAQTAIDQRLGNPPNARDTHQAFMAVVNAAGGGENAAMAVWLTLSASGLGQLLAGHLIAHPPNAAGEKKFSWNVNPNADDFVRASYITYVALFNKYVQAGMNGDRQPDDALKQSSGARRVGGKGILGTDDSALQGLAMNDPSKVAKFIRKAAQGQYSLDALKVAAQRLGANVDQGAILHATVQSALVEHVVRSYGPLVDQGSAAHVSAVAGALLINKYSKLEKNPALVPAGQAAIRRRLDAMYGKLTAPCTKDNYTAEDLKRIAKARALVIDPRAKTEQICAQLANAGVNPEAPTQQVSSGRREQTTAAVPRKPKSGGSGGALASLIQLPGGQQLSPGAAAVAARFAPGAQFQQTAQQLPRPASGGTQLPAPGLTRVPSGGRLTQTLLPAPTAGAGLQMPAPTAGVPGNILAQFSQRPQ